MVDVAVSFSFGVENVPQKPLSADGQLLLFKTVISPVDVLYAASTGTE